MSKKFTIPTVRFQDMVARATKGASENKLLPITSMLCLELKDNTLTLTTTDTANTLKVIATKIQGDDMYAVVPVAKFASLISRTTCDSITIKCDDKALVVNGNGVHTIDLCVDEDGVVQFPQYKFTKNGDGAIINLTSIKNILDINKACVAKTVDNPCLCGYYVGEKVITTNEDTICFNDMNLLDGDYLLSPEMMELLALSKQEKISWWYADGAFLFETDDLVLYGVEHDGKEDFPAEAVLGYLEVEFPAHCKLPKVALQDLLDRLTIFIEPFDKNGAYMTFTQEGVQIVSKKDSSHEVIPYTESENFKAFRCCVDVPMLKSLVDANPEDSIDIWYGDDDCLKFTAGKVTQVMALLSDEGMDNG